MRSALKPFEGIEIVDLKVGEKNFQVKYDAEKIDPKDLVAAMTEKGEAATLK